MYGESGASARCKQSLLCKGKDENIAKDIERPRYAEYRSMPPGDWECWPDAWTVPCQSRPDAAAKILLVSSYHTVMICHVMYVAIIAICAVNMICTNKPAFDPSLKTSNCIPGQWTSWMLSRISNTSTSNWSSRLQGFKASRYDVRFL